MSDTPSYEINRENRTGLIEVVSRGFWEVDDVRRYMSELADAISSTRRTGKPVRVLVDVRETRPRSDRAASEIRQGNLRIYGPGDRCAIVTSSTILKMQMRRYALSDLQQFFTSLDDAREWLLS